MNWFKFHHEALNDPKVQRLPGDLFKAWVNLLCLASQQDERGKLPPLGDCAFALRMDEGRCWEALDQLELAGLLDKIEGGFVIHNWDERQARKPSDERERVAERVRKHRAKEGSALQGRYKRESNATDKSKRESKSREDKSMAAPKPKRATLVPDEFVPTPEDIAWAVDEIGLRGSAEVVSETAKFLDHHRAKGSAMKDWRAAWKYWMRNSLNFRRNGTGVDKKTTTQRTVDNAEEAKRLLRQRNNEIEVKEFSVR